MTKTLKVHTWNRSEEKCKVVILQVSKYPILLTKNNDISEVKQSLNRFTVYLARSVTNKNQ